MPSGSFVLHWIERFPDTGARFKTEAIRPRGARDWQTAPVFTGINLAVPGTVAGFSQAHLTRLVGAWVSLKGGRTIRSHAMFGPHIDGEKEFRRVSGGGRLSSITVTSTFDRRPVRVSISRQGSAFFRGEHRLGLCLEYLKYLSTFDARES